MIRYGILGCGGHALQSHALPGDYVPDLALEVVCDIRQESIDNFVKEYGKNLRSTTNSELFYRTNIEAVLIATPDEFHLENLRQAITANKHVLVEKPLAINEDQLRELPEIFSEAEKRKLVIASCHPRRFDPPFLWLKEKTSTLIKEIGPIIGFDFDFSYHKPTAVWKHDRSLMLDHLNHEIDLLNFLYGHGHFNAWLELDVFDRYQVAGVRSDGISFKFHGTRRLEENKFLEWARVRHERGEVVVDTSTGLATVHFHESNVVWTEKCGVTDYPLRFRRVMQNFADAILGKADNYLTHKDLWINNCLGVKLQKWSKYSS